MNMMTGMKKTEKYGNKRNQMFEGKREKKRIEKYIRKECKGEEQSGTERN